MYKNPLPNGSSRGQSGPRGGSNQRPGQSRGGGNGAGVAGQSRGGGGAGVAGQSRGGGNGAGVASQSRGGGGGNRRRGNFIPPSMRNSGSGQGSQEGNNNNRNGFQGGNNNPKRQFDGPKIGFKRLYEFLKMDPDEVIVAISRNLSDWVVLLKSDTLITPRSDDLLVLIIQVIAEKICSEDILSKQNQFEVLSQSKGDAFIGRIMEKCNNISLLGDAGIRPLSSKNPMPIDQSPLKIVRNLYTFYSSLFNKFPNTACDCLHKLILPTINCFEALNKTEPEIEALHSEFLKLKNKYTELLKLKQSSLQAQSRVFQRGGFTEDEVEAIHQMPPEEDFRTIPIIPTIEELHSDSQVCLKPNKKTGAYYDSQHYLDVQFRLLREDFVRPLKLGIGDYLKNRNDYLDKKYKKKMPLGNVRIYPDVEVAGVYLVKEILVYNIRLPESIYKRIKWDRSKRLIHGSLLVFTSDLFKTASFAIVKERDANQLTQRGILGVIWEGRAPDFKGNKSFLMVECEVYFEAFRHNLERLKNIELERFPMNRFVVYASADVNPPAYLSQAVQGNDVSLRLGKPDVGFNLQDPLQLATWPSGSELGLDDAQFFAFQAAITKEFAIIQGPPGTGKTFLGLKLAEVFLSNEQIYFPSKSLAPILVVCYTNHALDQFLEGILEYMERNPRYIQIEPDSDNESESKYIVVRPQIVRVGSRSKSEKLGEYSLESLRRSSNSLSRTFRDARRLAMNNLDAFQEERFELLEVYKFLENYNGLVDFQRLKPKIWERLKPELPTKLWESLASPDWYGLSSALFKKQNFSAENTFKNWFGGWIREAPIDSLQSLMNKINLKENVQNPQEVELDQEEEDFDMEELMRNRFIDTRDDAITEFLKNRKREYSASQFLPRCIGNYSLVSLRREIAKGRAQIQKVFNDPELSDVVRFNVQKNIEDWVEEQDKKYQLLSSILRALKDRKIEIPNGVEVKNIIDKVEEGILRFGITQNVKFGLYGYALERAKVLLLEEISRVNERIAGGHRKLKEAYEIADADILRRSRIVGMTTTGAAKYSNLVEIMKSKIVIVEEAAEVLESHIVTCLTRHCQHLILIGDHQQLKPSTTVYELSKKYNLDISLFERMINNKLSCYKLKTQHRMRPEIANLVVGTIYPELLNHPSVNNYPVVRGITKNLFFIAHTELEKSESDSMSKSNEHEALFMAHLARHFVLQGYDPTQITVLTTYTGQMFLIKKKMRGFVDTNGVRVTVVDNFQGEENDIILLSLVRSNEERQKNSDVIGKIGFLKEDNRICVALSRAKHGLFVIGNMDSLSANSGTWAKIKEKLEEREEIGEKLALRCGNHGTTTLVRNWEDFVSVPEGGCIIPCEAKLKCGHNCRLVCHIKDSEHVLYKCAFRCEKNCPNLHQCQSKCFKCAEGCSPCTKRMEKSLGCGHIKEMLCHEPEDEAICGEIVEKTLPCGHKGTMACHKNADKYQCRIKVKKLLRCGIPEHMREMECFKNPEEVDCKAIVDKTLPCGHNQEAQCFIHPDNVDCHNKIDKILEGCDHTVKVECKDKDKKRLPCKEKCTTRLECGHACPQPCHFFQDAAHENVECMRECSRTCPEGLHKCTASHKCLVPCPPCPAEVEKRLLCGHSKMIECAVDPGTSECLSPCERVLPCKHKCQGLCFQKPCGDCKEIVKKFSDECGHYQKLECSKLASKASCEEMVQLGSKGSCGHDVKVPCRRQNLITPEDATDFCRAPCTKRFDESLGGCDHQCKGDCKLCLHGRIHLKCKEDCGRQLICGHTCGYPCSATCPPCIKKCIQRCEHSECQKPCGEPCQGCTEPCGWKCPHHVCTALCGELCNRNPCDEPCPEIIKKCGHPCVGFCGEPCPPLCRECDKEELINLICLGNEEEENSRWVYLVDCKHTIESIGLEMHLRITDGNGEEGGNELNAVKAKVCPYCSTVIRTNRRFGNLIKAQYNDVNKVRRKVWGNTEAFRKSQQQLFHEMDKNVLVGKYFSTFQDNFLKKLARKEGKKGKTIRFHQMNSWTIQSLEIIASHVQASAKILDKSDPGPLNSQAAKAKENKERMDMERLRRLGVDNRFYNNNFNQFRAPRGAKMLEKKIPEKPKLNHMLFNDLHNHYSNLILGLWERIPLNPTEISDFGREFERLFDLEQIYLRKSSPKFPDEHVVGKKIYIELIRSILGPYIYTDERKKLVISKLKELDEAIKSGLGISESEKREIIAAMGFSKGHWFKCRNGHIYAIGECGGANQEAKCPECDARIGGGNHHLLPDNALAPEMDGAVRHAFPGGLH